MAVFFLHYSTFIIWHYFTKKSFFLPHLKKISISLDLCILVLFRVLSIHIIYFETYFVSFDWWQPLLISSHGFSFFPIRFWGLLYLLAPNIDILAWRCIFFAPVLESAISPKKAWFLLVGVVHRAVCMFSVIGIFLLLGSNSGHRKQYM